MWSWLQKLMNTFRDPEQEERVHTPAASTTRQIQFRTKSIYPRERAGERQTNRARMEKERKFRFPVIPDKQSATRKRDAAREAEKPLTQRRQEPAQRYQEYTQQNHERAQKKVDEVQSGKQAYTTSDVLSPIYNKINPVRQERPFAGKMEQSNEPERPSTVEENLPFAREGSRSFGNLGLLKQERRENKEVVAQPSEDWSSAAPLQADGQSVAGQTTEEHTYIADSVDIGGLAAEEVQQEKREQAGQEPATEWNEAVQSEAEMAIVWNKADGLLVEPALVAADVQPVAEAQQSVNDDESQISEESTWDGAAAGYDTAYGPVAVLQEATPLQTAAGHSHEAETVVPTGHPLPESASQEHSPLEPIPMTTGTAESTATSAEVKRTTFSFAHEQHAFTNENNAYNNPTVDLLNPSPVLTENYYEYTLEQKQLLEETLSNFNVSAQVVGIVKGPSVTRFELQPAPGVKVNKITSLTDDIKLNMAAKDIRIEAPIPGRNAVGIEVPNIKSEPIFIRRIIGSDKFREHPSPLAIALGMDIGGEPIVGDIKKMPHGLIAGSTGSGKSVCINSIIVSLLYKATPEQVRLLLIDPKMVELAPYNHLPHLVTPVVTDAKQATAALKWAVEEMEKRYALFVDAGVRDIDRYNQTTDEPLPFIVIIIDELADLMMVSPQDVEDCIIRIAQKARACGIHLLLATQRPSVDVITGNIKANVPTRLAFAVFSQVDSRTILDQTGAERLLGRGDMLFLESGATPVRLQGNFVSDDEIERITQMIKKQRKPEYLFSKEDLEQSVQSYDMGDDSLYHEALVYVAEQGHASASALQRRFRIGYNRAARLIEMMESQGHVAGQMGGKPRAVLITPEDAQALTEGTSLF